MAFRSYRHVTILFPIQVQVRLTSPIKFFRELWHCWIKSEFAMRHITSKTSSTAVYQKLNLWTCSLFARCATMRWRRDPPRTGCRREKETWIPSNVYSCRSGGSFCAFDNPTVREIILFAHSIAADRQMYVKETRGMSVLWRMSPWAVAGPGPSSSSSLTMEMKMEKPWIPKCHVDGIQPDYCFSQGPLVNYIKYT